MENNEPGVHLSFRENSVAILTLSNPTRKNALTVSMMQDLDRHVQTLAAWSRGSTGVQRDTKDAQGSVGDAQGHDNNARVVILTGSGNAFCSGLDLHDNDPKNVEHAEEAHIGSTGSSLKEGPNMIRHMTRVTNQFLSLPVLSIAAVDGHAVGGGAELTTCTDLVVLSRSAKIEFVHAKRGASMGWGGGRRLVQKVGRGRALRLLLLGECVSGEEEARRGGAYADAIADEGETALEATMRQFVAPLLALPCAQSIRAIKRVVSAADGDGNVTDVVDGRLKLETNMAMKAEFESFVSVWGGESNRQQIQKAKEGLRDKPSKSKPGISKEV